MQTQTRLWSILSVIILAAILGLAAFNTYSAEQHRRARQQLTQDIVKNQRDLVSSLLSDYQTAAYSNDQIDRITEQQLLAAEHQLVALQLIALQNTQIMELLASE